MTSDVDSTRLLKRKPVEEEGAKEGGQEQEEEEQDEDKEEEEVKKDTDRRNIRQYGLFMAHAMGRWLRTSPYIAGNPSMRTQSASGNISSSN